MLTLIPGRIASAVAGLLLGVMLTANAHAMTVEPVVVDLKAAGHGMNQVIAVENNGSYPLPVELTVQELALSSDGVHATGKDSGDVVAFPPQASIAPGQTQTFRIQYMGDPALGHSKHYYVTVAQLPVNLPQTPVGINVLYNFQVLVNVGPPGVRPALRISAAEIGRSAAGNAVPVLTVTNDSASYGYLSHGQLRLVEKDRSGHSVLNRVLSGAEIEQAIGLGLIGSGQSRQVMLPLVLPEAEGTVEAQFVPVK